MVTYAVNSLRFVFEKALHSSVLSLYRSAETMNSSSENSASDAELSKDGSHIGSACTDSEVELNKPITETVSSTTRHATRAHVESLRQPELSNESFAGSDGQLDSSSEDDVSISKNVHQRFAPASSSTTIYSVHSSVASKRLFDKQSLQHHQQASLLSMWSNSGKDYRTREQLVREERERYLSMTLNEKRKFYSCGDNYTKLKQVPTWQDYLKYDRLRRKYPSEDDICRYVGSSSSFTPNSEINKKVSVWRGDITTLEIDAIVNAANVSLLGGGGVDGAIHRSAGSALLAECRTLKGCEVGDAKITGGYKLPSRYVVHTVGPQGEYEHMLRSCYLRCVEEMRQLNLFSIAFPCISTGIFGYPNERAAHVALRAVRQWLDKLASQKKLSCVDRIIFCVFLDVDLRLYESWMQFYFPTAPSNCAARDESDSKLSHAAVESVTEDDKKEECTGMSVEVEKTESSASRDHNGAISSPQSASLNTSTDSTENIVVERTSKYDEMITSDTDTDNCMKRTSESTRDNSKRLKSISDESLFETETSTLSCS